MWLIKMSSSVRITVPLGAALLLCCSFVDLIGNDLMQVMLPKVKLKPFCEKWDLFYSVDNKPILCST